MGRRGPSLNPLHLAKIEDLARKRLGWSAARIVRELAKDFPNDKLPSDRTVRALVANIKSKGHGQKLWLLERADGDDARLILEVLPAAIRDCNDLDPWLTEEQASWALRLRKAAPTLPAEVTWMLVRLYMGRVESDEDTRDLDAFLAVGPLIFGSGDDAGEEYFDAYWSLHERHWPRRKWLASNSIKLKSCLGQSESARLCDWMVREAIEPEFRFSDPRAVNDSDETEL